MTNNKKPFQEAGFKRWVSYVEGYAELFIQGKNIPFNERPPRQVHATTQSSAKIVICSPHPDDETLTGLLPLRLSQEGDVEVVTLAVTLGSNPKRKKERRKELQAACSVLGFRYNVFEDPPDFKQRASQDVCAENKDRQRQIDKMVTYFAQEQPDMVICPHADDGHPAHAGTNFLALRALGEYSTSNNKEVIFVESEFWNPMKNPNVLIGANTGHVAKLVCALAQHQGEISRTPYHLYLPAWMMDNVRRGGELIKGYGHTGVDFLFGELYRLSRIKSGKQVVAFDQGHIFGPEFYLDVDVFKRSQ